MREYKRQLGSRTYKDWSENSVQQALESINNGSSISEAAKTFGVQRTTLSRRYRGLTTSVHGRPTALNSDEEKNLASYAALLSEWAFPLTAFDLRQLVKNHLDLHGRTVEKFNNNLPGAEWATAFIKRHQNLLSTRLANNIKMSQNSQFHESIIGMLNHMRYEKPVRKIVKKKKLNVEPGKSIGQTCDESGDDEDVPGPSVVAKERQQNVVAESTHESDESAYDLEEDQDLEEFADPRQDENNSTTNALNPVNDLDDLKIGDWVAVMYDHEWFIGVVEGKSTENNDVQVKFLHPAQSSRFKFPSKDDLCWLALKDIIGILCDPPVPSGSRFFEIPVDTMMQIDKKLND